MLGNDIKCDVYANVQLKFVLLLLVVVVVVVVLLIVACFCCGKICFCYFVLSCFCLGLFFGSWWWSFDSFVSCLFVFNVVCLFVRGARFDS